MKEGICKLTQERGTFVKSHILPEALTKPTKPGNCFIQSGNSTPPKKRWSSWYDKKLVIRKGEDILSKYDGFAIEELRRLKLIWQSWNSIDELNVLRPYAYNAFSSYLPYFGLRKVICQHSKKLRLFFLSLLWRSASTHLTEFSYIKLDNVELEEIRTMILREQSEPLDFYPITLLQMASKGHIHNFVPIVIDNMVDIGGGKKCRHNVFRFYFDGLIVNFHRSMPTISGCEPFIVGYDKELIIQQQLYEESWQRANLEKSVVETEIKYAKKT